MALLNCLPRAYVTPGRRIPGSGHDGPTGVLTSRTVKVMVRFDEHSARCVARSRSGWLLMRRPWGRLCGVRPGTIYRVCVSSSSSFSPNEIRAAAETHRELGPDYRDAVVDSFLDKVGREIDARVDARLAAARNVPQQPERAPRRPISEVAMVGLTMGLGIPLSAIAVAAGRHPAGTWGLIIVWAAIAVI